MLSRFGRLTRRHLLQYLGMAGCSGAMLQAQGTAAAGSGLKIGPNIYESIGVRPVVNCKGTFTIVSGSLMLPEVRQAMIEASKHYVHLDELMEGVSKRLAELTRAEWGIVTNGCAAALAHATAACIAGADPEKLQRIPDLTGLKNEVIAPRHSRNVYDHAVRMLGVKIVTVTTAEELERAINPRTAMIMVLAAPAADREPLSTATVSRIAARHKVPVLVDAAAEILTIPNKHLDAGATMVCYSGGKCLRGPQSAGLLLGRKDLVQAAWLHSAPHHAFGRPMKAGKEEIMGMLAAVEAWVKRDYDAEYKVWEGWLASIARKVTAVQGVTTEVIEPSGLSNLSPRLQVHWDSQKLGITGREVERILLAGDPRIVLAGARGDRGLETASSVMIMPYMMNPEDHRVVADRLHSVLSKPPKQPAASRSDTAAANLAGQWRVTMKYFCGEAEHRLFLEQNGGALLGIHHATTMNGTLRGDVAGDEVRFRSRHRYEGTTLDYEFTGKASGARMSGTVSMGEYGIGEWVAERYQYQA
ncbi:MAG: aminotransferase class V-fold PLP-dependent enzyme [Bryobacteraceae bacterium]